MMIFNELRKHGRLASKRHPMYEKNKVAKIFGYIGVAFWAGYLIFFGTTFAFGFADMVPNREPYHVMNAVVLIFILALDFLLRVPFQKTPTQEVKPYLLLPVKRNRIIDFLLIRSGLIISLFIIKSSISIFIDSNVELMDGVKDVNVYNKIFEAVEQVPGASNPHRVRSRMIGNLYMITLDIEVNPQITITQAHQIADSVEKSIKSSIDNVYDILVHVEPAGECQTDEKFGIDKGMVN